MGDSLKTLSKKLEEIFEASGRLTKSVESQEKVLLFFWWRLGE